MYVIPINSILLTRWKRARAEGDIYG